MVDSERHDLQEELSIVVSLKDGVVLHTSPNLTELLGFPKDMWIGRSLVDFIHPKHRVAFASHITSIITSPNAPDLTPPNGSNGRRSYFYCCLRQYRGLRSTGFNMKDKRVMYVPCQLTTAFKEVSPNQHTRHPNDRVFLVVTAVAVRSAYNYGDELKSSVKFMTRHLANTVVSHIDTEVTPYLGYLPQDILGRSVFDFYHPEDLPLLKDVYESVMKKQSEPFRSKPYRFRCQNDGFALVETEWSSFINPWTHKLEFIIGQHTILRGPPNPDVTTPVEEEPLQISEQLMKDSKLLQEQIKCLLNEIVVPMTDTTKQQVSKRCKDLATFMETVMDTKPPDLKLDVLTDNHSFSERDSVMLGEISPHHDYYNSKSSTETPPSYNQLNYNENLQRFFESKPKTTLSDESGDTKDEAPVPSASSPGEGKISPPVISRDASLQRSCCFTTNSGTSSGQSTESNSHGNCAEPTQGNNTDRNNSYKPPTLTEQLLSKHNEDMEKQMMQKHRELRSKGEGKPKDRHKTTHDKLQAMDESGCHGVKRCGSHSWEGEPYKSMKTGAVEGDSPPPCAPQIAPQSANDKPLNLWPPFSVGVTPLHSSQPSFTTPALASPLVPMYYVPEPRREQKITGPFQHPTYITQQVSYIPGMVYQPLAVLGSAPLVYSPLTVLPTPVYPPTTAEQHHRNPADQERGSGGGRSQCGGAGKGRPPSQATSVKAEPGSNLCSVASLQQGLSEKGKTISSPGRLSPASLSPRVDKKPELDVDSNGTSNVFDDSSIYSSFYSFLKTDKSDESMKSSPETETKVEDMVWEKTDKQNGHNTRPIKKVAPWLEDINVTEDLVLKYQLEETHLQDVLNRDIKVLERIAQPSLVNDQLNQMYLDLEVEGVGKQLILEDGITSSSESSGEESIVQRIKKKRYMEYDKMVILFEENAPLPPPQITTPCV